jgi:hypothetical protein
MDATYTKLQVIGNTFLPYRLNNLEYRFICLNHQRITLVAFPGGGVAPSVTQDNLGLSQSCAVHNDREALYAIILLAVRVLCPLF